MNPNLTVPRVELPNATEEEIAGIAAAKEAVEWNTYMQRRFIAALLRKGRPFLGVTKNKPKPTKHQRHKARCAARSAYLKGETV